MTEKEFNQILNDQMEALELAKDLRYVDTGFIHKMGILKVIKKGVIKPASAKTVYNRIVLEKLIPCERISNKWQCKISDIKKYLFDS